MPASTVDSHVAQFSDIVHRLIRLKSRLKLVDAKDDEFARIKKRLMHSHPRGKSGSIADAEIVFQLGALLADEKNSLTMTRLSQALVVPDSTATRIMDWLVGNGYVERRSDPTDRRIVRVALTPAGKAMYKILNDHMCSRIRHLLESLSSRERTNLLRLLGKLVEALEEEKC